MPNHFRHPYVIGLHDTDAAGIIYSANIIRICMIGYEAMLVDIGYGLPLLFRRRTLGLPVVHVEADFQKPLTVGERVILLMHISKIGRSSYRVDFEVVNDREERCATAAIVYVCTDPKTGRSMDLPSELRTALEKYS